MSTLLNVLRQTHGSSSLNSASRHPPTGSTMYYFIFPLLIALSLDCQLQGSKGLDRRFGAVHSAGRTVPSLQLHESEN